MVWHKTAFRFSSTNETSYNACVAWVGLSTGERIHIESTVSDGFMLSSEQGFRMALPRTNMMRLLNPRTRGLAESEGSSIRSNRRELLFSVSGRLLGTCGKAEMIAAIAEL